MKIGDRVVLKKNLVSGKRYGSITYYSWFTESVNSPFTIKAISDEGNVRENGLYISMEMLELVDMSILDLLERY